ncbi:hypothetical protein [Hymenobacter terrenus]|uniref:hypothetical protein n=1 Tax=Hymenobacter terrenus TaxID=1629124 RepID=UPI0012E065AB|nr:hypothetical protein [Hymenobacter terrenus]
MSNGIGNEGISRGRASGPRQTIVRRYPGSCNPRRGRGSPGGNAKTRGTRAEPLARARNRPAGGRNGGAAGRMPWRGGESWWREGGASGRGSGGRGAGAERGGAGEMRLGAGAEESGGLENLLSS